jgi:hypothetical protein
MRVNSRKPSVRLSTMDAIDRYDWDLSQDGALVESARNVTTGITDGTCIRFAPNTPLRRGSVRDAGLPEGYFFPPFGTRWAYRTSSYAGHSDFAVDLNRGGPGADEGDRVTAPAPGIVAQLDFRVPGTDGPDDPGVSDVLIDHAGGYRTLYSHMKGIPRRVRVGAPIELRQQLGRISDVGTTTGSHLHHCHYRRVRGSASGFGTPIKMRFQDVPMDASVGNSETGHEEGWVVEGQRVRGPILRGVFKVRVWRQTHRSRWRELRFTVAMEGQEVPHCVDPGCPPAP